MKKEKCKIFDSNTNPCSAPLCPLDEESLEHGIWYSDEEICRSAKYGSSLKWVQNQKKIAKKSNRTDLYYNLAMLDRDIIIRKGITGLDPDSENPEQDLKKWLKAHPEQTQETKEKLKQKASENFKLSTG